METLGPRDRGGAAFRLAQFSTLTCVTGILFLVTFNNVTDYGANLLFVQHVLTMDTTFQSPSTAWRAIHSPALHHVMYVTIILWEALSTLLCAAGVVRIARVLSGDKAAFRKAAAPAVLGLACSNVLWLAGFLGIGGEWFLMWQSSTWNGQQAATRMFLVTTLTLLLIAFGEDRT
jgi:predicted small integral membrane protein